MVLVSSNSLDFIMFKRYFYSNAYKDIEYLKTKENTNINVNFVWKEPKTPLLFLKEFSPESGGILSFTILPHTKVLKPFNVPFDIPRCEMTLMNLFSMSVDLILNIRGHKRTFPWPFGNVYTDCSGRVCCDPFMGPLVWIKEVYREELIKSNDISVEFDLYMYATAAYSHFFDSNFNRDLRFCENTFHRLIDEETLKQYNIEHDDHLDKLVFLKSSE